jgi:NADH-quinone oxidoreductase subunit G
MRDYANVLLPIAPFTETSGTYISQDGTVQSFTGVVRPLGEARPGWKVLRVLGDLLEANVGSFNSSEDVKAAALASFSEAALGSQGAALDASNTANVSGLERVADIPIYHSDALVRRGHALSISAYGKQPSLRISPATAERLGLNGGAKTKITQGGYTATSVLVVDRTVADGAVRIPVGTELSAALGDVSATVTLEAA